MHAPDNRATATALAITMISLSLTAPLQAASRYQPGEEYPGGSTSQPVGRPRDAFSQPSATLPFEQRLDFHVGKSLFEKLWVASPPPPPPATVWDRCSTPAPAPAVTCTTAAVTRRPRRRAMPFRCSCA
ncbi:hypothetical protein [Marinobacterium aestuariivivens]|uniref:Uncharacterized protein n=1 Tax=Marinobacterium aestuariivivens TaxID=1698799 RepID=A0ABW2A424_9GAMM